MKERQTLPLQGRDTETARRGGCLNLCLAAPVPPPYGGIGNWVLLMRRFVVDRKDISIQYLNTAPSSRNIDGRSLWARVVKDGMRALSLGRELRAKIKSGCIDVMHLTTSGQLSVFRDIFLLWTAKRKKIPTVYHIRFGRVQDIAQRNTLEWKLISTAMRLATVVMTLDQRTFSTISEKLPQVKPVLVPNPIDLAGFPDPLHTDSRTVLFLGWVMDTKGAEELLKAWEKTTLSHPDWVLKMVGPIKPEYRQYLESNYGLCNVEILGEMDHDEALGVMNNSEVFVLPSHTEGFPNVILEAMALAKPIIATRVGAIPEILGDGCGVLIDSHSVESLEQALDKVLSESALRRELGERAHRKLKCEYDVNIVFSRYMEEWRKLDA